MSKLLFVTNRHTTVLNAGSKMSKLLFVTNRHTTVLNAGSKLLSRWGGPSSAVGPNGISQAQLADMAAYTIKMRNAATTGDPQDVKISALTEETSPASGDWIFGENESGVLVKMDASNISGTQSRTDTATTSDATPTPIIISDALADNTSYKFRAEVIGRAQDGSGNSWSYVLQCAFDQTGGTLSAVDEGVTDIIGESIPLAFTAANRPKLQANDSSKQIEARVTGQAATDINWKVRSECFSVA